MLCQPKLNLHKLFGFNKRKKQFCLSNLSDLKIGETDDQLEYGRYNSILEFLPSGTILLERKIEEDSDNHNVLWLTDEKSKFLRLGIIGGQSTFKGPFGTRICLYIDTTASGKALTIIEDFVRENVLPFYANTHTEISFTSFMTTSYRHEARNVVAQTVGADLNEDTVLFCGYGTTSAIHKLIHCLDMGQGPQPFVLVGPYEHHSNLLPWRETGAEVINVPENPLTGSIDERALEKILQEISGKTGQNNHRKKRNERKRPIYAAFSAGSNVTGAVMDDVRITQLIHHYGGFSLWDYAAAAPHVDIQMNPRLNTELEDGKTRGERIIKNNYFYASPRKDALYFSGHKFLGGVQTPGVLVIKNHLFKNKVPHGAGGGTVFFVTPQRHEYLQNREEAEEGGTPAIVESIRLGSVLLLRQQTIGIQNILAREAYFTKKVLRSWSNIPGLILLGNLKAPRLPIISFVIQHEKSGYYLHQNFVVALLNDLFGIQCRGGCMCAGPYAQTLLGINLEMAGQYERALSIDCSNLEREEHERLKNKTNPVYHMIYRPGFTRVSLPFEASSEEINFLIQAVVMVAQNGWKLLPLYNYSAATGVFYHRNRKSFQVDNGFVFNQYNQKTKSDDQHHVKPTSMPEALKFAERIFDSVSALSQASQRQRRRAKHGLYFFNFSFEADFKSDAEYERPQLNPSLAHLRWFMLPSDALEFLRNSPRAQIKSPLPFVVQKYADSDSSIFQEFTLGSIPSQLQRCQNSLISLQKLAVTKIS